MVTAAGVRRLAEVAQRLQFELCEDGVHGHADFCQGRAGYFVTPRACRKTFQIVQRAMWLDDLEVVALSVGNYWY